MRKWLFIGTAVLLAVAAAAVWVNFSRPDFVAGLIASALTLFLGATWPGLKWLFRPATGKNLKQFHQNKDRAEDFGLPGQRQRDER